MLKWLKNVVVLLIALGVYYLVAYLVVVTTINSSSVKQAIYDAGGTPEEQVAASFQALFPVPIALTLIGIILSKWIKF